MVGYVEDLLLSFNLGPEDIPKALGLLMFAKGTALATGLAVGLRYQPLRRLVLAKRLVVQSSPWMQQQRLRMIEALDKAKRYDRGQFMSPWAQQQRVRALEMLEHAKTYKRGHVVNSWAQRLRPHVLDTLGRGKQRASKELRAGADVQAAQVHTRNVKEGLRDTKARVKSVGQKLLLLRQLSREQQLAKQARHSWRGWLSKKYWQFADSVAASAGKNSIFLLLGSRLGVMPKTLVLGTAEGLLLSKLAMPLVLPLSLLISVQMFKSPGSSLVSAEQATYEHEPDVE